MKIQRLLPLLCISSVALIMGGIWGANQLVASTPVNSAPQTTINTSQKVDKPTSTRTTSTGAVLSAQTNTPACTLGTLAQALPVNLSARSAGLTRVNQEAGSYALYGTDVATIRSQMLACSPVTKDGQRFAASTEYAMNWSYTIVGNGTGVCSVQNVRVGVAVSQTYPSWQSANQAPASTQAEWNRFITNLHTHEDGHTNLDIEYAERLLQSLQNLPAESCASIATTANTIALSIIAQLDQANEAYDQTTGHGTTQGAVL